MSHTKRTLVFLSIVWLACSDAATTKNIRETSRGRRLEVTSTTLSTAVLPNMAEQHPIKVMPLAAPKLVLVPQGSAASPLASLDASKKLAELPGEDVNSSNSSTNDLKPSSGTRDLQVAGSELLKIEARSLKSHSTDYHRPIYDYNDHGDYKDSRDSSSDYSRRDGYDRPYKSPASNDYHDDHGHSSNYEHGHDSEHGHDAGLGHSGVTGHSDDVQGGHETHHEQGGHDHGADYHSGHGEGSSYGGGHSGGALSEAGHDIGSRGHVNKGHSEDGFDTVHHKEEYGFSETFGDDEDLTKYHDSQEHFDDFHTSDNEKNFFGSSFMDDHSHDHFGTSGDHGRGSYHDQKDDISSSYGHEGDFGHKASFGEHDSSAHDDHYHDTPVHYDPDFDHHRSSYGDDHHVGIPHNDGYPHSIAQASIDAKFDSTIPHSFSSVDPGLIHGVPKRDVGLYESAVGPYGYHDPLFRSDVTGPFPHYSI